MADHKSNSSNNDRRLKKPVEIEFSSDDEDQGWSSETSPSSSSSVAASLREFGETMMRRQVMELEMIKARESARIRKENQRLERETEFTEMMLKTQLQITSFICSQTTDRKRKRDEEADTRSPSSVSLQREGAMLLTLLQFNFGI